LSKPRIDLDPDGPDSKDNDEMDVEDEDVMMAMMGMSGFGSTKVSCTLSCVGAF
jgi:hypothetical protein